MTPGPWRWMNTTSLVGDHGRRPAVLTGIDLRQRDGDGRLRELDIDSDDARLIEAAPDLLACVEAELALHDKMDVEQRDRDPVVYGIRQQFHGKRIAAARAAVAKARGVR